MNRTTPATTVSTVPRIAPSIITRILTRQPVTSGRETETIGPSCPVPGSRLGGMRELPAEMVLPEGMVPDEPPATPVVPRDAATVVLIRDTATRPEVFLQRRVTGMA